jgi:hypothetical protein
VGALAVSGLAGGFQTAGGQFIKLNIFGGADCPNGCVAFPITSDSVGLAPFAPRPPISFQMFVFDPTHPDGYRLSAPCEVMVIAAGR